MYEFTDEGFKINNKIWQIVILNIGYLSTLAYIV